ncbi:MAG: Rpn family recombination-promoting nuclease/putative transposase [Magnetococcales bacterium]|nr:Rpn family recombination-promoting nuclease/putative transposase [Magnetococcales bacterium]
MAQQESKISHPHDHFCRAMIADPEKAAALIHEQLPEEIASSLSSELPELVDVSFVDDTLRELFSDRLYRVRTVHGQLALIYVLIDHKSSADVAVAWQLLKYLVEAWKQWERENPDWQQLPPIIPFILYHGQAKWRVADEFLALVAAEESWRPYLLNFRFRVMDLGQIPDRQLSRQPKLRVCLLAMKYATRDKQQLEAREWLIEALLEAPDELPFVFRYIAETYPVYNEQILREIVQRILPQEGDTMTSQFVQDIVAQNKPEWVQFGRQEGIKEGIKEGQSAILLRQMQRRFGAVPDWIHDRVLRATTDQLEQWSELILDAQSPRDLFAK